MFTGIINRRRSSSLLVNCKHLRHPPFQKSLVPWNSGIRQKLVKDDAVLCNRLREESYQHAGSEAIITS